MSDEFAEAAAKFVKALADGDCPTCGTKVESRRTEGRCAYAEPCGHRLGQVGPKRRRKR